MKWFDDAERAFVGSIVYQNMLDIHGKIRIASIFVVSFLDARFFSHLSLMTPVCE